MKREIESTVFECKDRGYAVVASYLKPPHNQVALVEVFRAGTLMREFDFPAYKVWNIAAHFKDIVDGEIENSSRGYEMAASNGIEGMTFLTTK